MKIKKLRYKWRLFGIAANLLDLMTEHYQEIDEVDPEISGLMEEALDKITEIVLKLSNKER